jgi:hypothetical protein
MANRLSSFLFLAALCAVTTADAATTNFFETFEAGLGAAWSVGDANADGTPGYWGIVDSAFGGEGTHGGSKKIYCAGVGYAGTTSAPLYQDDMTAYLQRSVNLTGYSNATLSFWFKLPGIETGFDSANVYLDSTLLWSRDTTVTSWTPVILSLDSFVGAVHTLKFEFTSDVSANDEGWYLDDVAVVSGPANDMFTNAYTIIGGSNSITANNSGATNEAGEPNPGNSIWFRWTAQTNGTVTFRTGGSSFDTILCIYAGTNLATLTSVGCDDNSGSNNTSVVSFNAVAGTIYSISVRGATNAQGGVALSWDQPNGRGKDILPDLFVWADESRDYLYGWRLDSNEIPGRVLLRISTATPNIGSGPLELRGSSTTPGVYQRVFRSDGTWWDRYAGTFTFHPGHQHLHFDNWLNFHLREVLGSNGVGNIVVSGDKTSFAIIDLTVYDTALPGSPASEQYGGGLVQGLSVGWADVYGENLTDQWIDVTDVPAGRYWLEAVVDPANSILELNESNNVSRILIDLDVIPTHGGSVQNDMFANAFVLNGVTAGLIGSTVGATRENGEPAHGGNIGGASVWFRWTAPSNMNVTITTEGSSLDTLLGVYRGTTISNLSLVVSNDDSTGGVWSKVTFAATSNTTYQIALDGYDGVTDAYEFNFNPAWNDNFANALVVTGASGTVSASSRGATRQPGETNHAGIFGSNSIWFVWTAPRSGAAIFQTIGSGFDTLLGVYTGNSVSSLSLVAADDDAAGGGASRVTFNCVSNTTYRIAIDGPNGERGIAHLNWAGPAPPGILTQPLSTNAPAGSAITFSVTAVGSAPLQYQWRHQGTNVLNDTYHSGANTAALGLEKAQTANAGAYSVVITNAYGAITSAPGNLIVLDNPRVVFIEETLGYSGAFVRVPVEMQSVGNEHAVSFSLLFDPLVLSNPRALNVPAASTLALETNGLSSGVLGVSVTLPGTTTFVPGHVGIVDVVFNTEASSGAVQTFAGFAATPVARAVKDTNGVVVPVLFVAGSIDLEPLRLLSGVKSNGTYRLIFPADATYRYAIDASVDLTNWMALTTSSVAGATFQFADTNALPQRFYRVRLMP